MSVLSAAAVFLVALAGTLVVGLLAGVFFLVWKVLKAVFWLVARALGFVRREAVDVLHTAGALVTAAATVPLSLVNLAILRLGSAKHYGRAVVEELKGVGAGVWRVALGNPLRFLGAGALVDGLEQRLPDAVARAPHGMRARKARRATFDGYDVIGTLPSGGSGAQLFVARPRNSARERFLRAGRTLPGEVVIKSFALESGSTLPQIVRESRALEAASRLGLVCEHQLSADHFYYVMPYVKGDDLERVTRALHARGGPDGLADAELGLAIGYAIDLCDALQRFHTGGLWHKDVKPSNVIVAGGRAHLVDFGLVTPLASALTLTTHGTEYYRDPEMVRLAMQGVKVHEVDGVRFDVYSAGAVLYSLVENCFPQHGSLSRLSRRSPEALRWIVQRAMADLSSRYASAADMRADLAALAAARDPFALRPADLPSFTRVPENPVIPDFAPVFAGSFESAAPQAAAFVPAAPRAHRARTARRLAGAGVAGLLALGVVTSGTLVLAARARHGGHGHVTVSHSSVPAPERAWNSLTPAERRYLELAQGVIAEVGGADAVLDPEYEARAAAGSMDPAASATHDHAHAAAVEILPGPPTAGLPPRGRVLVLDDVTTRVDDRVIGLLHERLAERGFTVAAEAEDGVELLASARHAMGLGRADEPDTQTSLQRFLDGSTEVDAIVLVSRTADEKDHLYRVFVRAAEPATASVGLR
jgi:serine/threonine protein kinase